MNINNSQITIDKIDSARDWITNNLQDEIFKGTVVKVSLDDRYKK